MTDTERLKDNIESLWDIANGLASYSGVKLSDKEIEIVKYFIEQAERVQKLEKIRGIVANAHIDNLEKIDAENKRYREALEFYADKSIYNIYYDDVGIIGKDGGNKARQAIKGEKNV